MYNGSEAQKKQMYTSFLGISICKNLSQLLGRLVYSTRIQMKSMCYGQYQFWRTTVFKQTNYDQVIMLQRVPSKYYILRTISMFNSIMSLKSFIIVSRFLSTDIDD